MRSSLCRQKHSLALLCLICEMIRDVRDTHVMIFPYAVTVEKYFQRWNSASEKARGGTR